MNFDKRLAFRGIRALYGNDGFEKLQSSHVTVIGVGGIGSWATEALCRTAIGSLTLIDNDTIELTNSNRQLHTTSKLGVPNLIYTKFYLLYINFWLIVGNDIFVRYFMRPDLNNLVSAFFC